MQETTILIVDDDPKVRSLLANCFEEESIKTIQAEDEESAMTAVKRKAPDLVTLDLHLGSENGLDIARNIKAHSDVPIIMVTGKDDVMDRIIGLEVGADDYITKPFHVREVLARVRAVLRRAEGKPDTAENPGKVAKFAGWRVDPDRFEITQPNGSPCVLTTAEFKLLNVFLQHPKRILSREQLMDLVEGGNWAPLDRTIDNQIARLRRKIEEDPANPALIKTVRGVGYSFTTDVDWR